MSTKVYNRFFYLSSMSDLHVKGTPKIWEFFGWGGEIRFWSGRLGVGGFSGRVCFMFHGEAIPYVVFVPVSRIT